MSKQENTGMMVPPSGETTMMVPPTQTNLMVPPRPMSNEEMLKVSGGEDEKPSPGIDLPKPPEMKVVELKDGGFVCVPDIAICKTEEEAKQFEMPDMPHPHLHHPHHHKHHHPKP